MKVGAVVLMYDHWPGPALDALLAQTHPAEHILLIDNASPRDVTDQLAFEYPDVEILRLPENGGYAAGMNAGIARLKKRAPEAFLLLTHECQLECDSLKHLTDALMRHPDAGLVGPILGYLDEPDRVFSAGGILADVYGGVKHRTSPGAISDWSEHQQLVATDWLDGACLLIRGSTVADVGQFDESYFLYFEDVEYSLRVRDHGYQVLCVPQAIARQSTGNGYTREVIAGNGLRLLLHRRATWWAVLRHLAQSFWWTVVRQRPVRTAPLRFLKWLRTVYGALTLSANVSRT